MCINTRTHTIFLRSLTEEVIEQNLEGWSTLIQDELLAAATWAADSRSILVFSDMELYATVWSLTEQQPVARFESPRHLPPKGIDFSSNGLFMVIL